MLLGVLKIYFLTQDMALANQITPATLANIAGNAEAGAILNNAVAAAKSGAGTFNIMYMQAMGSVLSPPGSVTTLEVLLFFAFALGFAIKVPMFPFHTWLPDAHVEAPTAGSVILAGILLKLGTYGFYRFNLPMFPAASADESYFGSFGVRSITIFLAIVGIIYGALAAMYFVVKKDGDVKAPDYPRAGTARQRANYWEGYALRHHRSKAELPGPIDLSESMQVPNLERDSRSPTGRLRVARARKPRAVVADGNHPGRYRRLDARRDRA
jgi:hypothetical protein